MNTVIRNIMIALLILTFAPPSISMAQSSGAQPSGSKHRIVIDAGHGGTDRGVVLSDNYNEKDFTLSIATMIKKELEKYANMLVLLTRSSDNDLSLSERKKFISSSRGDIFLGIHVNAGFGKTSTGYELYLAGVTSVTSEQVNTKDILEDMTKNKYLNDSVKLGQLIQRNLDTVFPRKNRGIRNAPLVAVDGLTIPAVIVEIGFATNPEDRKKLMDESVRSAIARALSRSIKEYF